MKLPDIPPEVAREIMGDLQAFRAEKNGTKRDAIAATTLERLRPYWRGEKLRVFQIREMFEQWRDD
jgi:hypothetical protein